MGGGCRLPDFNANYEIPKWKRGASTSNMAKYPSTEAELANKKRDISTQIEEGYTYIETLCAMFVLFLIISSLLFWVETVQINAQKWSNQSQVLNDLSFLQEYMGNEIAGGKEVVISGATIDLWARDGRIIRYYVKNGKLIRTIHQPGEENFRGATILSNRIQSIYPKHEQGGISILLHMKGEDSLMKQHQMFFRYQKGDR
jgi:hypothetical protein